MFVSLLLHRGPKHAWAVLLWFQPPALTVWLLLNFRLLPAKVFNTLMLVYITHCLNPFRPCLTIWPARTPSFGRGGSAGRLSPTGAATGLLHFEGSYMCVWPSSKSRRRGAEVGSVELKSCQTNWPSSLPWYPGKGKMMWSGQPNGLTSSHAFATSFPHRTMKFWIAKILDAATWPPKSRAKLTWPVIFKLQRPHRTWMANIGA